jgi:hypothetical protein
MRVPRSRLVRTVNLGLIASLCAFGAHGCTSPTDAVAPVVILRDETYLFACDAWTPATPPTTRTLLDIRSMQNSDAGPPEDLVRTIERAGGRDVHRYNGPMVRAELNVAAVARLGVNFAQTVADTDAHDVHLIVRLTRPVTAADILALEALGGRVLSQWTIIDGYVAVIDDSKVPALRALPGVGSASFDGMFRFD